MKQMIGDRTSQKEQRHQKQYSLEILIAVRCDEGEDKSDNRNKKRIGPFQWLCDKVVNEYESQEPKITAAHIQPTQLSSALALMRSLT